MLKNGSNHIGIIRNSKKEKSLLYKKYCDGRDIIIYIDPLLFSSYDVYLEVLLYMNYLCYGGIAYRVRVSLLLITGI